MGIIESIRKLPEKVKKHFPIYTRSLDEFAAVVKNKQVTLITAEILAANHYLSSDPELKFDHRYFIIFSSKDPKTSNRKIIFREHYETLSRRQNGSAGLDKIVATMKGYVTAVDRLKEIGSDLPNVSAVITGIDEITLKEYLSLAKKLKIKPLPRAER